MGHSGQEVQLLKYLTYQVMHLLLSDTASKCQSQLLVNFD